MTEKEAMNKKEAAVLNLLCTMNTFGVRPKRTVVDIWNVQP